MQVRIENGRIFSDDLSLVDFINKMNINSRFFFLYFFFLALFRHRENNDQVFPPCGVALNGFFLHLLFILICTKLFKWNEIAILKVVMLKRMGNMVK
jgi:hypothetical protein